ncbi:pilus assembly protein [Pseudoxanthomonas composti]|nr:PilC/PilY family type IV pilus protein [Pseudoxanthomonas composti]
MGVALALLAGQASAGIVMPTEPLTTSARIPPNVLFILDDSGSMSFTTMPDQMGETRKPKLDEEGDLISAQTYVRNWIYYNPAVSYEPWVDSSGTVMTGGTSYTSVYTNESSLTGSANLSNADRDFYVPKDESRKDEDYLRNGANYYRYQLRTDGRVIRSEWVEGAANEGLRNSGCSGSNGAGYRWKLCTRVTPTGRTEADEFTNFATWYSYHRTRMKVAKAGSGRAFSALGSNIRVGFRTIHQRNASSIPGNVITEDYPIPVQRNNGLFEDPNGPAGSDNNRTLWFDRLYSASGSDATPSRKALERAGTYFSSSSANGPWGPESGSDQYACRQNFAILTSDGYSNESYSGVGEQDSAAGAKIVGPKNAAYEYTPGPPYSGKTGDSNTMADVAMRYWKSDLRSDLENVVPVTAEDPAFWQHMVTFGISIGSRGRLDPTTALPGLVAGTTAWPSPGKNVIENIDDMWHATINGRGKFLVATDPEQFKQGLQDSLATIANRTGSFSNVSANGARVQAGTYIYQSRYLSGIWSGELSAYAWSGVTSSFNTTASWEAGSLIQYAGRRVFTSDGTVGAEFPTPSQQVALERTGSSNFPVTGADNAQYIKGDRSLEANQGGNLRNRTTLLGDIVSSSPVYDPRTNTIYVGANDGMLHAFNANNGQERFAYVPAGLNFTELASLSRPDYEHRYFVDGSILVSSETQTPGKSYLVSPLGRGGKGLFALDVTSPGSFASNKVMWEKTETPGRNMGLILGRPIIGRLNTGDTVVIVGNGLNSSNDKAALLIYDLATGTLIKEINTNVGSATAPNGLMAPIGRDEDGNGTLDTIYAGDMLGNVWKFSLTGGAGSWDGASKMKKLFSAARGGVVQPITGGLMVGVEPSTFKTWVFFGTGRFITVGDIIDKSVQSLYGIVDSGATVSRASLTERKIKIIGTASNGLPARGFEANSALPPASPGWFIDLLTPPNPPGTAEGERVVGTPVMDGSVLVVSSVIPTNTACESDGRGFLNALDAFTGTSTLTSYFDVNNDGDFTNDNIGSGSSQTPIGSVDLGVGMVSQPSLLGGGNGTGEVCVGGSMGNKACVAKEDPRTAGRVSWREVRTN